MAAQHPRRLLTIAHSYCVALNRRLAHEMARAGGEQWEVTAVAPRFFHGDLRPIPLEPQPGELCRVVAIDVYLSRIAQLFFYGRSLRAVMRERWDLVHCWEEPYVIAGGQVARWSPPVAKLVFYTAQNIAKSYPPPFSMIERMCAERAAGWLAGGETVAQTQIERCWSRKPHRVVPLGVDVELFRPDAESGRATRARLGWNDQGPPVVGFLGRFIEAKGLQLLMRVLDETASPWRALFVGGGPGEAALKNWASRHGDRVRIVGGVPHDRVPEYLNAMDLMLAPSQTTARWREQFGRMLIEAFACGVPVLASDSGEIPYVVADAGVIVGERDETGWRRALADLLESPARRAELAARGRDRAHTLYSWPVVARRHLEFFNELLAGQSLVQRLRKGHRLPKLADTSDAIISRAVVPARATGRKLRLLSIAHSYCVAMNRRLAHEMARVGHADWDVTAVAPEFFQGDLRPIPTEPIEAELCRLELVPAFLTDRIHFFFYGRKLREILHQPWDLVHCWEEPYIVAGGQIAWWTPRDIPLVFWTGQTISKTYPPPFSEIERYCIRRCAGWMTRGQNGVDVLMPRGHGYEGKPYRVMPLGVDLEHFFPDRSAGSKVRSQLRWSDEGPPVVGFLGRFVEEKGIRTLTAALERLRTPWRAMFVGGGPLERYLRDWATPFSDRVRIVTGVEHGSVPAHINAMDILCAPSQTTSRWREVFGRMVIEAFACGIPVIASDCGELPSVVADSGMIVRESDSGELSRAIDRLLKGPALRDEYARRGLESAKEKYAWPIIAQRHLEFFEELISAKESGPH